MVQKQQPSTRLTITDLEDEFANLEENAAKMERGMDEPETEHDKVIEKLLSKVDIVNFRELVGLEDDEKLKRKHFQVTTIEELLSLAAKNKWGLCKRHDFIYLYNGAYWGLLPSDDIKNLLGNAAEKMGVDKYDCRSYQFKDLLFKQFLSAAYLPEPKQYKETVLINLKNGTFEVTPTGGKMKPFDRQEFLTYQ